MHQGASPAIYLNAKGTELSNYLLREFQRHFADHNTVKLLKKDYTDEADSIIQYYALINTISDRFDFSWEREWRFPGDLAFNYMDVYAIVAPNPRKFLLRCERRLTPKAYKLICRIPIVSPDWNYERILHEFAVKLWNAD